MQTDQNLGRKGFIPALKEVVTPLGCIYLSRLVRHIWLEFLGVFLLGRSSTRRKYVWSASWQNR